MKEKSKVCLAIIAKDKASIITTMLDSTKGVFDCYVMQDTGSSDNTIEVFTNWCKEHKKDFKVDQKFIGKDYRQVIVDGKPMLGDFGKARNDSFALIPDTYKWAFWIDTDDILINAEQIPELVKYCNKNNIDEAILVYDYAKPIDGIKAVTQKRERLINLEKEGLWLNWVHEGYSINPPATIVFPDQLPFQIYIEHQRSSFEALATNRRNNLIMKAQLAEEGIDKFPDQMLHHLAYDCWEHREWVEASEYYLLLLKRWKGKPIAVDQALNVLTKTAQCFISQKKLDEAIKYALQAMQVSPQFADGYLLLAQIYADMGNWDEVEYYSDKILKIGKPNTTNPINEFDYSITPLTYKLQVYIRRNDITNAIKVIIQLRQLMPSNAQFITEYHNLLKEQKRQLTMQALDALMLYYQENNNAIELEKIRTAIPIELLDDDFMRRKIKEIKHDQLRKSRREVYKEGYVKSIVIFAGQGYENWDGNSDSKGGIGGSEGMCLQMARELAKLNNKVYVYNSCGDSDGRVIDGVTYLDWRKWDADAKCNIFISLRRPDVFSKLIKATKQFLWLHDTDYGEYPLLNFYTPNKVIVLTEAHKQIIKQSHGIHKDDIFWVSRNAINANALEFADKNAKERDPYQLIYASSYDRGLENLLAMWPKIIKEVPEAKLIIAYGTKTMDAMIEMRMQTNPQSAMPLRQLKSRIFEGIARNKNVMELGRLSQNDLYTKFKESGLWVYPTEFYEISCITAMTAQALGAIPVCTPYAALNETVSSKFGIKVNLDKFADAIIYQLQHIKEAEDKREPMMKWAREVYDMKSLALEWNNTFNSL